MTDLIVSSSVSDARALLTVSGDLDLATLPELRGAAEAHLDTPGLREVHLQLAGLTFLDSSGLGLFVELRNRALAKGVTLRLVDVPDAAARVIGIAGLAESFGLDDNRGTAG